MCVIYSWFVSSRFRFRMCQLSAPTHRNGGNCLIRIRNASITTMRPHRRPYGIGRASVTLFRWPSCKRSSRIPIPASDGSRQRRKSNLRCQSSRSSSCCSTPPCRQQTKRGVANVQVAAMEQWPHPKRSSAARPTAKWSLVREAVKVFGMNWLNFCLYYIIYIPLETTCAASARVTHPVQWTCSSTSSRVMPLGVHKVRN